MTYTPASRNRAGIQFASAFRNQIDQAFEELHDGLSVAYYDHWRQGESWPWTVRGRTFDKAETPEQSKVRFDKLHALLHHHYDRVFHARNLARPAGQRIPVADYDEMRDAAGVVMARRSVLAAAAIARLRDEDGLEIDVGE